MKIWFAVVLAFFLAITDSRSEAQQPKSEKRFALLIANQNYDFGKLDNPKRDIELIASSLVRIGFPEENIVKEVDLRDADSLRQTVKRYVERVKAAGEGTISFFYYSGHGVAAPRDARTARGNYIIPTGLDTIARPDVWERAVALDQITGMLSEAREAVTIAVFDACRTLAPARGVRGFEEVSVSQEVELLVAFSTAPNTVAWDSWKGSPNSPYAHALAEEIVKSGIDHLHLFANIRTDVMNTTGRQQIPWVHDGLLRTLMLNPRAASAAEPVVCDAAAPVVPEIPIVWMDVSDKSMIRFKSHTYTYEMPRTNSRHIEEVNQATTHFVSRGTRISEGVQDGQIAWYRYQSDMGTRRPRYVVADEVDLH